MTGNNFKEIMKPTLAVGGINLVLVGGMQPLFCLLAKTGWFTYDLTAFLLGSLYGMLIGVGNFFLMAISLALLTTSGAEAAEAKKKAQISYTARSFGMIALAVVGCVIPIFSAVAVILSLAVTQFGIVVYALIVRTAELRKMGNTTAPVEGEAEELPSEEDGEEPTDSEDGDDQANEKAPEGLTDES